MYKQNFWLKYITWPHSESFLPSTLDGQSAVVVHIGSSLNRGHYISIVKSEDIFVSDPLPRPYVLKPVNEGSSVGVAIVTVAAKIGYLTSVTNPLALVVAQPLLGIPVFSGAGFRLALFVLFLPLGIWYLLRRAPAMRTAMRSSQR